MKNKFSRRVIARTIAAKLASEPARQEHWMRALAAFLVENRREHEAGLIMNDIAHELFVQQGHLTVDVTSARPLSEAVRTSLEHSLRALTDAKTVELHASIDPGLIGGLVARTPDAVLDMSVRSRLNQLATIK